MVYLGRGQRGHSVASASAIMPDWEAFLLAQGAPASWEWGPGCLPLLVKVKVSRCVGITFPTATATFRRVEFASCSTPSPPRGLWLVWQKETG